MYHTSSIWSLYFFHIAKDQLLLSPELRAALDQILTENMYFGETIPQFLQIQSDIRSFLTSLLEKRTDLKVCLEKLTRCVNTHY